MGTWCLKVYWANMSLGTWSSRSGVRCKADNLASHKKYLFKKSKEFKTGCLQIWQNLLCKAMAQKGLSDNDDEANVKCAFILDNE